MIFKPSFHGICQIHGFSAEVNSRQTSRAFEILCDVSVIPRIADLRDSEKTSGMYAHSKGYPISGGTMESFCKQLSLRMKGPGMRWNIGQALLVNGIWDGKVRQVITGEED